MFRQTMSSTFCTSVLCYVKQVGSQGVQVNIPDPFKQAGASWHSRDLCMIDQDVVQHAWGLTVET